MGGRGSIGHDTMSVRGAPDRGVSQGILVLPGEVHVQAGVVKTRPRSIRDGLRVMPNMFPLLPVALWMRKRVSRMSRTRVLLLLVVLGVVEHARE